MKHALSFFALLLAAGGSIAVDIAPFPFYRELSPPAAGTGDVAGVILDRAIYGAAAAPATPGENAIQAQLRIIDQDAGETPFCFRKKTPVKSALCDIPFPARVLSFRELPDNRVEIMVKRDSRRPAPAGLRIHTSKLNFEKLVTVSGSADSEHWTILAEAAPIFDYSRFINVRNDRIGFKPNDFIFFKIEVANITETKDSPLTEIIRKRAGGVETETTEINAFRKEPFRMDRLDFLEQKETFQPGETETRDEPVPEWIATPETRQHQTVVTFNTAREPVTALILETRESNFSRPVTVSGADTPNGAWTELAANRISRVDAGKIHQVQMTIPLNGEQRYRHYRILIDNQDNPPLAIAGLLLRENIYEVLFFPKPGSRYRLYYGGHGMQPPSYDTETVLSAVPPGTALAWTMGEKQPNPEFKPDRRQPWLNSKVLLIVAIVLMVGVLIWAIIRATRNLDTTGKEPNGPAE